MSRAIEGQLRAPVAAWLRARGMVPLFEVCMAGQCDVVGVKHAERVGHAIPALREVVIVELKMHDAAGVLRQCHNARHYAQQTWAAMPVSRIAKMRECTQAKFAVAGVGLLAVDVEAGTVQVVLQAREREVEIGTRFRKKLWRRHLRALRESRNAALQNRR